MLEPRLPEVGVTTPHFGYETFEDKPTVDASDGLLAGAIYSMGAHPRSDFLDTFTKKYPGERYYTASHCYDIILLYADATRERKNGVSIAPSLGELEIYPTVPGVMSSTGDNRVILPTTGKTLDAKGHPKAVAQ